MSSSSSSTARNPYVVINIGKRGNANTIPFKKALEPPDPKKKTKTLFNTFFYVFTTKVNDATYWKIGETYDPNTYLSKNRFCPMLDYDGVFQILHYGKMIEKLVVAYLDDVLNGSFKGSEWYINAGDAINSLYDALRRNGTMLMEDAKQMTNVRAFPAKSGFTCGAMPASTQAIDAYLSVFRVRYKGAIYRLCAENVQLAIGAMTNSKYLVEPAPVAAAPAPARSLTASVQDAFEDDDSEESSDTSSSDDESE